MDGLVEASVEVGDLARRGVDVDVQSSGTSVPSPGWVTVSGASAAASLTGVNLEGVDLPPTPYPLTRPHLDPEPLAALAPTWRVGVVDTSPSTHQALAAEARSGEAGPGTVLVAEHQTAGRGRLDRTWTTPSRAALTVSLVVAPTMSDEDWPWLPLLLGTSVVAGIRAAGGPDCGLKWPNDVMAASGDAGGDAPTARTSSSAACWPSGSSPAAVGCPSRSSASGST